MGWVIQCRSPFKNWPTGLRFISPMIVLLESCSVPRVYPTLLTFIRSLEERGFQILIICELLEVENFWRQLGYATIKYEDLQWLKFQKRSFVIDILENSFLKELFAFERSYLSESDFLKFQETTAKLACRLLKGASSFVSQTRPSMVFCWNGNGIWKTRILRMTAERARLPIYYMERGFFPHSLCIDPCGANAYSRYGLGKWRDYVDRMSDQDLNRTKAFLSKYHQERDSVVQAINPSESNTASSNNVGRKILLPIQVEADSNIVFFSPVFKQMIPFIKYILDICRQRNISIELIVKHHPDKQHHPKLKARLESEILKIKDNRLNFIQSANVHDLIQKADVFVTLNSNTGLEALTYQKPVITLGDSFYSGAGITYDCRTQKECAERIPALFKNPQKPPEERLIAFFCFVLRNYLFFENGHEAFPNSNRQIIETVLRDKKINLSKITPTDAPRIYIEPLTKEAHDSVLQNSHILVILKTRKKSVADLIKFIHSLNPRIKIHLLTRDSFGPIPENILEHCDSVEIYYHFFEFVKKLSKYRFLTNFCIFAANSDVRFSLVQMVYYATIRTFKFSAFSSTAHIFSHSE